MTDLNLKITWASEDQREIFTNPVRYNVIRCGRRWGKTKGAFQRLKEIGLIPKRQYLWVDTTQANIEKYFNEHLHPDLPKEIYHWNKQQKVLTIKGGSVIHFGSAERPENLEGFGYHEILLNEAGIILKGESGEKLWYNTILPMTIDYKAFVWLIGTPKGVGLFKEMSEWGRSDDSKWKEWRDVHRTTYDNPLIRDAEVDALVAETHQTAVRQEIFADFMETDEGSPIIPWEVAKEALERVTEPDETYVVLWGVDPSQGGDDEAGLAKRRGNKLLGAEGKRGFSSTEGSSQGARWIKNEYDETDEDERPVCIMVDVIGLGAGWYDAMRLLGLPVRSVNVSQKSHQQEKYFQKRDELWYKAAKWLETGCLSGNRKIFNELVKPLLDQAFINKHGRIKIESKDLMKKRLKKEGASPNLADALIITFDYGNELKSTRHERYRGHRRQNTGRTWMSA